jgi:hypothetical protein
MLVSSRTAFMRLAAVTTPAVKRSLTSSPAASMRLARSTHASAGPRSAWLCGGSASNHASASAAFSVRRFSDKAGQKAAAAEEGGEEAAGKAKPEEKAKAEAAPEDPHAALKEQMAKLEADNKDLKNRYELVC